MFWLNECVFLATAVPPQDKALRFKMPPSAGESDKTVITPGK